MSDGSLLAGVEPGNDDGTGDGVVDAGGGALPAGGDVDNDDGAGGQPPAGEDPLGGLTLEQHREQWQTALREGVPETPDAYELPEIEGVDPSSFEGPTMATLRAAAHEAGIKPDDFKKLVSDWHAASQQEIEEHRAEQVALLGQTPEAVQQRLGAVSGFLTRALPQDERDALMAMATSAAAIKGLERLMNRQPVGSSSAPPEPEDTPEVISQLMNSKGYTGFGVDRDPAVVARVNRFFEKGGKVL